MKRHSKTILIIGLVTLSLFILSSVGFAAEQAVFSDIDQASWAKKNIVRMKVRNIISGFNDGTFRPNVAVRQVEALIMAVNELGLKDEASQYSSETVLPEEVGENIPDWAKGYVAVGLDRGLIKRDENNFTWDSSADRAWIAVLTVRMMGMEKQALQKYYYRTGFIDDREIPDWARGYVAVALENGIFVGYADNTFQPKRTVTRAEMATILAKAEQYMELPGILQGTVDDVNRDNIIIYDDKDILYRLYISDSAWIFNGNNQVGLEELEDGDAISAIVTNSNTVEFIDILDNNSSSNPVSIERKVSGEVVSIDEDDEEIRIEDEDGDRTTYDIDSDVDIEIDGISHPDLDDIDVGDEVELTLEDGDVVEIEVISDSKVKGEVVSIDEDDEEIRIEDEDGDRTTYDIDSDVDIEIDGISHPDLDDIDVGDEVELTLEDGDVVEIEVISDDKVRGEVVSINEDDEEIRIEDKDGDRTTYDIDSHVDIEIDGISHPDLDDIDVGDNVELTLEDEEVVIIEVLSGTEYIRCEVVSIDEDDEEIRVEESNGDRTTYDLDRDVDIEMDDESDPDLDDIRSGDQVKITVENGEVTKIEVLSERNITSGVVVRIDESKREIRIEDDDDDRATYDIESWADIEIEGYRSPDLDDIDEGDYVELRIEDGDVTRIEVLPVVRGEVTMIDSDDEEIRVEDVDGDETTYDVENDVEVEIDGDDDYDLDDIDAGDEVKLWLENGDVYFIEVL